jgi:hypothetical protein
MRQGLAKIIEKVCISTYYESAETDLHRVENACCIDYADTWMSKRHTITVHHIITVYNVVFDHMDGVMRALAKKKTQWKEHIFFAVNCARQ